MTPSFPWHIVFVSLPPGLILGGALLDLAKHMDDQHRRWLFPAASVLLWGGTLFLIPVCATGFLTPSIRFVDVPHIPYASHRFLGLWTLGLFLVLSLWRWKMRTASALFTMVWLAAAGVFMGTSWFGWNIGHRIDLGGSFF